MISEIYCYDKPNGSGQLPKHLLYIHFSVYATVPKEGFPLACIDLKLLLY